MWKLVNFDIFFFEVSPVGCDWWEIIIGLDSGLVPNMH